VIGGFTNYELGFYTPNGFISRGFSLIFLFHGVTRCFTLSYSVLPHSLKSVYFRDW